MIRLAKQTGVVLAALALSFAITAIGQGLWGAMAIANIRLTPGVPWSAVVMPVVLTGLARFLAGRTWPQWGASARRALVPLAPVSPKAWIWSLAAGVTGVVALAGLWTVLSALIRAAPNALPDAHGLPLWTAIPMLLVSIIAAPLTEEMAFRGYAMGLLRRQFGPISAIVISSLMFMAAHYTQGLYPTKLLVYLFVGLGLAAIVWRTGSLLPAMAVHPFGDLTFFTLVWPNDAARKLVTEGGADASFYGAAALTMAGSVLCWVAFRRLLRVTSQAPRADATRTEVQPGAGAKSHA